MQASETTVQKLIEARTLIEAGWCQGDYKVEGESGPRYCASGAIREVTKNLRGDASDYLFRVICIQTGKYIGVPSWNDRPGRTKQEVLDLFDAAIEIAKSGKAPLSSI